MIKLAKKRTGWIGVDVGTSHLKVVQLVRNQRGVRLAASAIVPRTIAWDVGEMDEDRGSSSAGELSAAASLQADFRGRRVAATLPMALCQMHQLAGSLGRDSQRERTVRQSIETTNRRSAAHLQFAAWPAEVASKGSSPVKTNVLAVPQAWSDQLCDDIAATGWSCQLVDGLPLALARAVAMVHDGDPTEAWAALDWGYSQATFCVVVNRRPVYVRGLKNCDLRRMLDSITTELDVSQSEALRLLREHGLPSEKQSEVAEVVWELVSEPVSKLVEEMTRTISHLRSQRRTIAPAGVYLLGGGAALTGIASYLTKKLELEHRLWQLGGKGGNECSSSGLPTCMLGPAIALSALAWEKS
ncbi:MAG: hypothetical protein MI725_13285 [Pirellulales bacterium]|nr:hypothetical protein [Pirellulales bacterium]